MEVDINEPKSKAFNILLRMLQLSLQLISGYWASKHEFAPGCDYTIPNIISYVAYVLAALNFVAVIVTRCAKKFPRALFFVVFAIDFLIALAIIIVLAIKSNYNCAAAKIYQQFSLIEAAIAIVVSFVILITRLAWGQRYTNAPGNIAWPILFLAYQWSESFKAIMLIIGIGTAIVSFITLVIHLSTFIKTSTSTRKLLTADWIIGIVILLILETLAIIRYLNAGGVSDFLDVQAKRLLGIFILVNVVDILFWLWGLKTLDYEKGDQVRDNLFSGKDDFHSTRVVNDQSVIVSHNIGTIN